MFPQIYLRTAHINSSTDLSTDCSRGGDGQWLGAPSSQSVLLPLCAEHAQLMLLDVREAVAVAHLVVVRRQLLQELSDAVLLSSAVQVRHLVLGQTAEVPVHLERERKDRDNVSVIQKYLFVIVTSYF